ncbi:zinc finger C2HC domain-containing protein 1A isoform X1 [Oryzias latipes]
MLKLLLWVNWSNVILAKDASSRKFWKNMQKSAKRQQLKGGRFLIPVDRGQRVQTSPYSSLSNQSHKAQLAVRKICCGMLSYQAEPPKKPSNWRKKHEDFIATIRAAKSLTQVMKEGGPLPPPPPPSYDPDYIQCPYCQRRFNESAADRHIKFCQEQAARIPTKGKLGDPKKTPGRTQYKPPASVKKTNPSPASSIPSATSRLPQRSGLGQSTGIPSNKAPSAGSVQSNTSGITSPPSGVGNKTRAPNYGSARNFQPGAGVNRKKADSFMSRNDVDGTNEVGNGGMKSKFCHACGTKYPVESAKFCCECGVRRMCIG